MMLWRRFGRKGPCLRRLYAGPWRRCGPIVFVRVNELVLAGWFGL